MIKLIIAFHYFAKAPTKHMGEFKRQCDVCGTSHGMLAWGCSGRLVQQLRGTLCVIGRI